MGEEAAVDLAAVVEEVGKNETRVDMQTDAGFLDQSMLSA